MKRWNQFHHRFRADRLVALRVRGPRSLEHEDPKKPLERRYGEQREGAPSLCPSGSAAKSVTLRQLSQAPSERGRGHETMPARVLLRPRSRRARSAWGADSARLGGSCLRDEQQDDDSRDQPARSSPPPSGSPTMPRREGFISMRDGCSSRHGNRRNSASRGVPKRPGSPAGRRRRVKPQAVLPGRPLREQLRAATGRGGARRRALAGCQFAELSPDAVLDVDGDRSTRSAGSSRAQAEEARLGLDDHRATREAEACRRPPGRSGAFLRRHPYRVRRPPIHDHLGRTVAAGLPGVASLPLDVVARDVSCVGSRRRRGSRSPRLPANAASGFPCRGLQRLQRPRRASLSLGLGRRRRREVGHLESFTAASAGGSGSPSTLASCLLLVKNPVGRRSGAHLDAPGAPNLARDRDQRHVRRTAPTSPGSGTWTRSG